jgi:ABC-type Fe3+-hydroxamate transport system substrate-binding protein
MRRTSIAVLTAVCLALTACTSSGDSDDKPSSDSTAASAAASPTATVDAAAARQACVEAWAETIASRPADSDEDVEPTACKGLPSSDYNDMYFEGLQQANKQAREAFDACTNDPEKCTTAP